MKKVTLHDPVILAQSTTEPVFKGGYQDPVIRISADGVIYVRFSGRKDCLESFGLEETNPLYQSTDGGATWSKVSDHTAWTRAIKPLPNGDRLQMREHRPIMDITPETYAKFPKVPASRAGKDWGIYTSEELTPLFGDEVAKEFLCNRIYAGTDEVVEEICTVNWRNMPLCYYRGILVRGCFPSDAYKVDKDGVLWMPVRRRHVFENGEGTGLRSCIHLLRSDDFGHTWDYVNTVVYKEEYNAPNCRDIEGFLECALECLDDGSIIMVMRSGSLYPFPPLMGDKDHPAPLCYIAKTSDKGKSFDYVKPFYDYGIRPMSTKLDCGTIVLISGRPGVYIRTCDDPAGDVWGDIIPVLTVPEEDVYERYWHYSCSNSDVAPYGDHTAFITYSDFTIPAPSGEKAKSILVRKVTVD